MRQGARSGWRCAARVIGTVLAMHVAAAAATAAAVATVATGATAAAAATTAAARTRVVMMLVLAAARRGTGRAGCRARNHDVRAVAQLVGAVTHHAFADRKAFGDRYQIAARGAGSDRAHARGVVGLDDINVAARGALLHGGPGYDDGVV